MSDIPNNLDWQTIIDLKPHGYAEIRNPENTLMTAGVIESIEIDEGDNVVITLSNSGCFPLDPQMGLPDFEKVWIENETPQLSFPNFMVPFSIQNTPEKGKRVMFGLNLFYLENTETGYKIEIGKPFHGEKKTSAK